MFWAVRWLRAAFDPVSCATVLFLLFSLTLLDRAQIPRATARSISNDRSRAGPIDRSIPGERRGYMLDVTGVCRFVASTFRCSRRIRRIAKPARANVSVGKARSTRSKVRTTKNSVESERIDLPEPSTSTRSKYRHAPVTLGADASTRLLSVGRDKSRLGTFDERESPRRVRNDALSLSLSLSLFLFLFLSFSLSLCGIPAATLFRQTFAFVLATAYKTARARGASQTKTTVRRIEARYCVRGATSTTNYRRFRVSCSPQLH